MRLMSKYCLRCLLLSRSLVPTHPLNETKRRAESLLIHTDLDSPSIKADQ